MKHLWNQIESYEDEEGYVVDIVSIEFGHEYEAWLYHNGCGIKEFMFSVVSKTMSKADFTDMALSEYEDYIEDYDERYNY